MKSGTAGLSLVTAPRRFRYLVSSALAVAGLGAILAWAGTASALPCLGDTIGEPVNCTANDIRITDIHDVVVTDDGCATSTDTVTFNAILTVVTTATSRYDIGLFIGVDGKQAMNGECRVSALPIGPAPFRQLDGDACGDTSSAATINVAVTNVTVNCADANGDGQLDVASCTSWQQNGNQVCNVAADLEPGTAAKCNCPLLPIDIPIVVPEPLCTSNANCEDDATGCNVGICSPTDPAANQSGCVFTPSNSRCDDGLFCNGSEICSATLGCQAGTPPNCGDAVGCTTDACNETTNACTHTPNAALCSDALFCNGAETCSPTLGCQAAAAPNCADPFYCTADACNEATDTCTHVTQDALCGNTLFCDGDEFCSPTLGCQAGTPPNCADEIACTTDTCIESTNTCAHSPTDSRCIDGQFCNGAETCSATLGCVAGTPPNCADSVACTVDSCNETTDGCTHAAFDSLCSNNVFCDGSEICSVSLGCLPGSPPNCIDAAGCTVDSCNETFNRCDNIPNHTVCADSDVCTDDLCSPLTDCVHTNNTAPCDDHDQCTANDRCQADQCLPGESVCGNGVVDSACNEQCDSGSREFCNNGVDDDGDGFIDCSDSDCSDLTVVACDDVCQLAVPCVPILDDPAIMQTSGAFGGSFSFHGRMIPVTDVDPLVDGFVLVINNDNGEIFRAEVPPSALNTLGRDRYFLNATSSANALSNGGVTFLRIRRRMDEGEIAYTVKLRALGDFSRATTARMTTQMYFDDDVAFVTADWNKRPGRWTLYPSDY